MVNKGDITWPSYGMLLDVIYMYVKHTLETDEEFYIRVAHIS